MAFVTAGFLAFLLLVVNNLLVSFKELTAVEHHRTKLTLVDFRFWV